MQGNFPQSLHTASQTVSTGRAIAPDSARPSADEIAALAYQLWLARGCPDGSPDSDWLRAEQQLHAIGEAGELMAA